MTITLKEIKASVLVKNLIEQGNHYLGMLGYTDHGFMHVNLVSSVSRQILLELGYEVRLAELAGIAGYMHDIGNAVNRLNHSQSGALLAFQLLHEMGMEPGEVALIMAAIGNHDEGSGLPIDPVSAALILADKSHVHRTRVRNMDIATFDIHDRVNYAVEKSEVEIDANLRKITMRLLIDTEICSIMDYFEIFLSRMLLCRRAAEFLQAEFSLVINEARLL